MSNSIIDTYKTLADKSQGIYKDKGSRFLAFAFPVTSEDEIKEIIANLKKEFYDARHHCYSWAMGLNQERYRVNDDGEPSGTAGKPILGQIISHSISDVLIVVVRYFGGTLLGTRGLIDAYKSAASDCINNAKLIDRVLENELCIKFNFDLINTIMRIIKDENLSIKEQRYNGNDAEFYLKIPLSKWERIHSLFEKLYGLHMPET